MNRNCNEVLAFSEDFMNTSATPPSHCDLCYQVDVCVCG